MIRFVEGFFILEDGTAEEEARLDAKLERVAPGEKKWKPPGPSRGLGDLVKRVASAVGFKQCGGCKDRQKRLNELFPFKNGEEPPSF